MESNVTTNGKAEDIQTSQNESSLKYQSKSWHLEETNLSYHDIEQEPKIHTRTYFAVAAMLLLNYVQIIALQGPPLVVSRSHLRKPPLTLLTSSD